MTQPCFWLTSNQSIPASRTHPFVSLKSIICRLLFLFTSPSSLLLHQLTNNNLTKFYLPLLKILSPPVNRTPFSHQFKCFPDHDHNLKIIRPYYQLTKVIIFLPIIITVYSTNLKFRLPFATLATLNRLRSPLSLRQTRPHVSYSQINKFLSTTINDHL